MEFSTLYKDISAEINEELLTQKTIFLEELVNFTPKVESLFKKMVDTTNSGKRIRGFLVMLGYLISGGKDTKTALKGAVSYEIFQSAILIHDDVIDLSPTRRGIPTIHHSLGNNHYGISQAICLGDIGFFWSIRLMNSASLESTIKTTALNEFLNVMIKTGVGEILDVETPFFTQINKTDISSIHYFKTAEYSIAGPLRLGAIMANANQETIQTINEIGKYLGLAYQIKDDIIGVFGNELEIGKSTASDIEENKITHMFLFAQENASENQLKILQSIYGKKNITTEEISVIKQLFIKVGALNNANELINNYIEKSFHLINNSTFSATNKNILLDFANFLNHRVN